MSLFLSNPLAAPRTKPAVALLYGMLPEWLAVAPVDSPPRHTHLPVLGDDPPTPLSSLFEDLTLDSYNPGSTFTTALPTSPTP